MLSLTSHFGEQSTQVLKEVNHLFFHQVRNHEAIKVKEELKVLIRFLISFSVMAANGNEKSICPKVLSASTLSIFHGRLLCCHQCQSNYINQTNTWIKLLSFRQRGERTPKDHITWKNKKTHDIWPSTEIVRAMTHVINQGMAMYWGTSRWSAMEIMVSSCLFLLNGH